MRGPRGVVRGERSGGEERRGVLSAHGRATRGPAGGAVAALELLARPAGAERVATDTGELVVHVGRRGPHLGLAVLGRRAVGEVLRTPLLLEALGPDLRG